MKLFYELNEYFRPLFQYETYKKEQIRFLYLAQQSAQSINIYHLIIFFLKTLELMKGNCNIKEARTSTTHREPKRNGMRFQPPWGKVRITNI